MKKFHKNFKKSKQGFFLLVQRGFSSGDYEREISIDPIDNFAPSYYPFGTEYQAYQAYQVNRFSLVLSNIAQIRLPNLIEIVQPRHSVG